jgi:hypothetical protein
VAYINTSRRPSRRERSERRDSDVHEAGATPPRYGMGYFRNFPNTSVQVYCLGVSILRF